MDATISFGDTNNQSYNKLFSTEELSWALRKCRGNSAGIDDIGKQLPERALHCLLQKYNNIWRTGEIPNNWKTSLIVPFPKAEKDRLSVDSYRPISLLCCMSKVLERLVNRRLIQELESRNLLSDK